MLARGLTPNPNVNGNSLITCFVRYVRHGEVLCSCGMDTCQMCYPRSGVRYIFFSKGKKSCGAHHILTNNPNASIYFSFSLSLFLPPSPPLSLALSLSLSLTRALSLFLSLLYLPLSTYRSLPLHPSLFLFPSSLPLSLLTLSSLFLPL